MIGTLGSLMGDERKLPGFEWSDLLRGFSRKEKFVGRLVIHYDSEIPGWSWCLRVGYGTRHTLHIAPPSMGYYTPEDAVDAYEKAMRKLRTRFLRSVPDVSARQWRTFNAQKLKNAITSAERALTYARDAIGGLGKETGDE